MSLFEPQTVGYIVSSIGFDERSSVHIWHALEHAVCGSTDGNHACGDDDGVFVYAKNGEDVCLRCGKSLCVYCRLLLGWRV